jgi:hypothetical protein
LVLSSISSPLSLSTNGAREQNVMQIKYRDWNIEDSKNIGTGMKIIPKTNI